MRFLGAVILLTLACSVAAQVASPVAAPSAVPFAPSAPLHPGSTPSLLVALYRFENDTNLGFDSSLLNNHLVASSPQAALSSDKTTKAIGENSLKLGNSPTPSLPGSGASLVPASSSFPTSVPTQGNSFTIAAWIKPQNGTHSRAGIVSWGLFFKNFASNTLRLHPDYGFIQNFWGYSIRGKGFTLNDLLNRWTHIAVTYNADTRVRSLYLNGDVVSSWAVNRNVTAQLDVAPVNFRIGYATGTEYFNGNIDDVAIFNKALSPKQIQAVRAGDFSKWIARNQQGQFGNSTATPFNHTHHHHRHHHLHSHSRANLTAIAIQRAKQQAAAIQAEKIKQLFRAQRAKSEHKRKLRSYKSKLAARAKLIAKARKNKARHDRAARKALKARNREIKQQQNAIRLAQRKARRAARKQARKAKKQQLRQIKKAKKQAKAQRRAARKAAERKEREAAMQQLKETAAQAAQQIQAAQQTAQSQAQQVAEAAGTAAKETASVADAQARTLAAKFYDLSLKVNGKQKLPIKYNEPGQAFGNVYGTDDHKAIIDSHEKIQIDAPKWSRRDSTLWVAKQASKIAGKQHLRILEKFYPESAAYGEAIDVNEVNPESQIIVA